MDKNTQIILDKRIERTIQALNKNFFDAKRVENPQELIQELKALMPAGSSCSVGGSMTLFETGVVDFIKEGEFSYLDRYDPQYTPEQVVEVFRNALLCDFYFTSSNAITEDGQLYNVDGNGNRVAAMLYGPKNVVVVAGVNKIVRDADEAQRRVEDIAAPANVQRLNKATGCAKVGHCVDCPSECRVCNEYVRIRKCGIPGRIKVFLLPQEYGY